MHGRIFGGLQSVAVGLGHGLCVMRPVPLWRNKDAESGV